MSRTPSHVTVEIPAARTRLAAALACFLFTGSALAAHPRPSHAKAAPATSAKAAAVPAAPSVLDPWCAKLSARIPGLSTAQCTGSALLPTGALSRNGFPILARDIAAPLAPPHLARVANKKAPVRVLLLGGIHGDELTASALVFQWLGKMQTPAAQHFEWKVVPVLNPDGLLAAKPLRVNAQGVDLNRNFPTPGWQKEAPRYWAKATGSDPRRFPGHQPLSEPESRWVVDAIEQFHPDLIVSVHAPFGVLDFDGPVTPPHRFGRLIYSRVGVYPGSLGNYSGLYKHVPVITIELPNASSMPAPAEVERIWQDMLAWTRRNVPQQGAPLPDHAKVS
jgi:protein MpaA